MPTFTSENPDCRFSMAAATFLNYFATYTFVSWFPTWFAVVSWRWLFFPGGCLPSRWGLLRFST